MPRLSKDPKNLEATATTRQRLLDAACDEFLEVVFFETDTNKIARRAGLSPGTFYKYFKNKTAIFIAAFERLSNAESIQVAQSCLACLQHGGGLPDVAAVFAETLIESRRRLSLLRLQGEILLRTEPRVQECTRAVREHTLAVFQKYANASGFRIVPLESLHVRVHIINSLANAVACSEFRQYGVSEDQAQKEIVLQVLRCFATEHCDTP